MKIICLSVGKKHDKVLADAIEQYQTRLSGFVNFSFEYIPTCDVKSESAAILKFLKDEDEVILLDETGRTVTNAELASDLESAMNKSTKRTVFIIGGAYGVNQQVKDRSNKIYSLSKLVFPHQIVRLLLVEQLYRSFSILSGGKYHHS